jgi:hypothetical protein
MATTFIPWSEAPPEASYNTFEEAEADVMIWAKHHGYGLRRGRSNPDKKGDVRARWMQCDRARTNQTFSKERKHTKSRGEHCPFFFKIVRYASNNE